jgi:hypothetical protein
MAKKIDVTTASPKDADALIKAADAIAPMDASMVKAAPKPTLSGENIGDLKAQALRGKIPMTVRAGTEEVRQVNAENTGINTGGPANHGNRVTLKIDLLKVEVPKKETK